MKHPLFTGTATALITPFTADLKDVDLPFFERLCTDQIERGVNALVVAGTTGESPVLSPDEKKRLFRTAVRVSAGRVPVIAGTGSNNTEDAVRNANEAEKEGVNAILVVTPFYNKCTQDSAVDHYYYIADRVSVPVIVYNVPSRTGFSLKPETYLKLARHKNIAAVKEACGDLSAVAETMSLCGDSLTVYSGNDDQTVPIMSLGGKGVISVASNVIPDKMNAMTKTALDGDFRSAAAMQLSLIKLMGSLFCQVNPIPVKKAMEILWDTPLPLRLPLKEMTGVPEKDLRKTLREYALLS